MPAVAKHVEVGEVVVVQERSTPELSYKPELIKVRALRRGQYGVRKVLDAETEGEIVTKQVIERDAKIRNEGEVFHMDTADMRKWPLSLYGVFEENDLPVLEGVKRVGQPREMPHGEAEVIRTPSGSYELPTWVTKARPDEPLGEKGHTKRFGNLGELSGNTSNAQ